MDRAYYRKQLVLIVLCFVLIVNCGVGCSGTSTNDIDDADIVSSEKGGADQTQNTDISSTDDIEWDYYECLDEVKEFNLQSVTIIKRKKSYGHNASYELLHNFINKAS